MARYNITYSLDGTVYKEEEIYCKSLGTAKQSATKIAKDYPSTLTIEIRGQSGFLLARKNKGAWEALDGEVETETPDNAD